jgi:hypothetical protein
MQKLRLAHLYLGCIFAPLLTFFCISGIWQVLGLHDVRRGQAPGILAYLSTLHTGGHLRSAGRATLSSPFFEGLSIAMALSLIATIVLGVFMAFRFGRGRSALICLAIGIAVPVLLIVTARENPKAPLTPPAAPLSAHPS